MESTSPVAREDTQFTHLPPLMTPTEKVQSSVVMSSICATRAINSRIAERPDFSAQPAWDGRPNASMSKRAMA